MNTAIKRLLPCLCSAAGRLALLALVVCTPAHTAFAGTPNTIAIGGGNNQSGSVSTQLANPLSISFANNAPVTQLEWTVTGGSATFQENGSADFIDPSINGTVTPPPIASVHLILGTTAGPVTVNVTCTGCVDPGTGANTQTLVFNATATPLSNVISLSSGNNQSGSTFTELPSPLAVSFSGSANVTVDWQVTQGQATFQQSGATTYSQQFTSSPGSKASVRLDLGGTVGPVTVTATCSAGCSGAQQT